jgi:DNA transformation protein
VGAGTIVERVLDALSPLGPTAARAMFGGFGVYIDDAMLGLIADDVLYLKVDDGCREMFEAEGLAPFVYDGKDRPVTMSFHRAPEPLEDWDTLEPFARAAHGAARVAAAARARRRTEAAGSRPAR